MSAVEDFRQVYAELLVQKAGGGDPALQRAFGSVPRELFLGPGPWSAAAPQGYVSTRTSDPRIVYQDLPFALAVERRINNGQPGLHAAMLAQLRVAPGETVVHVGAGSGYYSAILSELVGPSGSVHAYEIEPDLAARASKNLTAWQNVTVHAGSGAEPALPPANVVYVNAGATHPLEAWLESLRWGGRLLFPLTGNDGDGAMLLVTRLEHERYAAKFISRVRFIPCMGVRDEVAALSVKSAFESRKMDEVQSLRRDGSIDAADWCGGANWRLSVAPAVT